MSSKSTDLTCMAVPLRVGGLLALSAVSLLAVGCDHWLPPEAKKEHATATPAAPNALTTPGPAFHPVADAGYSATSLNGVGNTGLGSGNGNRGEGGSGENNGQGSGATTDSDDGGTVIRGVGGSYSEVSQTSNGVTRKTIKRIDADGKTIVTTTSTDADGVVTTSNPAPATHPATHQSVARVISAVGVSSVEVNAQYGAIAVERATGAGQIEIHADVSFGDSRISVADAKRYAARFTIETTLAGGSLRVRATPPSDFPQGVAFTATYRLGVPEGMSLALSTANGPIRVLNTGARGTIAASTNYGAIRIEDSGATVDVNTANGTVTVTSRTPLTAVSGRSAYGTITVHADAAKVSLSTTNGGVAVCGARHARLISAHSDYGSVKVEDCSGAIDATTGNGSILYDATEGGTPTDLTSSSNYGSVTVRLHDLSALTHASLSTTNGTVGLHVPASASVAVAARTTNGSITARGIVGKVVRDGVGRSFDGAVNGGRTAITLRSDYGSIGIYTP